MALKENTSLAINTCSSQILVSNIIRQEKEPGLVGAKANSSTGAGNMQDETEASYRSTRKQQQQWKTNPTLIGNGVCQRITVTR